MSVSIIFSQDTDVPGGGDLHTRVYRVPLRLMYTPGEISTVWLMEQIASCGNMVRVSLMKGTFEDWQAIRDAIIQHDAAYERLRKGGEL